MGSDPFFVCPLTTLGMWPRAQAGKITYIGGFIEHSFSRILFYDAPSWAFVIAYSLFGSLGLATSFRYPSTQRRRRVLGTTLRP